MKEQPRVALFLCSISPSFSFVQAIGVTSDGAKGIVVTTKQGCTLLIHWLWVDGSSQDRGRGSGNFNTVCVRMHISLCMFLSSPTPFNFCSLQAQARTAVREAGLWWPSCPEDCGRRCHRQRPARLPCRFEEGLLTTFPSKPIFFSLCSWQSIQSVYQ